MTWLIYTSFFFGGACFTNAVPHLVSGLTGRSFPNVFSRPIGVGLSPPTVNFGWGWTNLVLGYLLIFRVGTFDVRSMESVLSAGIGSLTIGLTLSRHFGKLFEHRSDNS